jgi:hypothetical protein
MLESVRTLRSSYCILLAIAQSVAKLLYEWLSMYDLSNCLFQTLMHYAAVACAPCPVCASLQVSSAKLCE